MKIGVSVPITEIGHDLGAVREFVQAAEDLGYAHVRILEHVIGAVPDLHPEHPFFPYTDKTIMHEPFTLMGYLAALTERVELVTGILILPQRQTALVAKQAAAVDVLSGGRLRLGIGVGWNPVEYEALGQDFHNRGRRVEEQMELLRLFWTQEVVTFEGKWHKVTAAGINPLPVQRPIPIWIGVGTSRTPVPPEAALRRIGRMADGWMPIFGLDEAGRELIGRVHGYAREAGRDPADIGLEGRISPSPGTGPDDWVAEAGAWEAAGATHLSVGSSNRSPAEHVDTIRKVKEAVS